MLIKITIFVFAFFWLRASLPRIRYDQLMRLGWKVLIPGALVWTLMIATIRVWRRQGGSTGIYIVAGLIVATLMLLAWGWDAAEARRLKQAAEIDAEEAGAEADARAFPIPPLDLPHYHGVGLDPEAVPAASPAAANSTGKEVTGA
jgi:NADH-quinone oxidoreductase subunit H